MDPLTLLAAAGSLLASHPEVIQELVDVFKSGASADAVKAAIRGIKVTVSDEAFKEEMGVGP